MTDTKAINITPDGGVTKKVLASGSGDPIRHGQEVKINFTAKLASDNSIFDSTEKRGESLKLIIGNDMVIDGLEQGILTMLQGEKAEFKIEPQHAYGKVGSPPHIPGDSTLIYEIELVQIGDRRPTKWQMSEEELFNIATRMKDDGNAKFKAKNLAEAQKVYKEALTNLNNVKRDDADVNKLKVVLC